MPEVKPTLATAAVNANGVVYDVYGLQGTPDPVEHVPCLILSAPRPIAECPTEWMDGRIVWLLVENPNNRNEEYSGWGRGRWVNVKDGGCWLLLDMPHGTPTHIMLPLPAPQEAQDAL